MASFGVGQRVVRQGATGTVIKVYDLMNDYIVRGSTVPVYVVRWDNGDTSEVKEFNLSAT